MTDSRDPASGGNRTNAVREGQGFQNGRKDLFGTIGQLVENLKLDNSDGKTDDVGNNEKSKKELEELHWGNEKVVEVIESLCMNCHENVGYP